MKTKYTSQSRSAGYALILVMIMCAASLLIMAAVMNRTSTVSKLNNRNNQYTLCCTVAGAATEKVFARMAYDFQSYALGKVTTNLVSGLYATNIPTAAENSYWGNFVFSDAQGHANRTYVGFLTNYSGALPSQYTNLFTKTAPIYRIASNVSLAGSPDIIGTAQEDVLLALLPITTYAIFYNGPLEFTWTADMTVKGRTHANDIICVGTTAILTFVGIVTTTKTMQGPTRDGGTPSPWNQGTTFQSGYITNVPSVTVAMTMTNSHAIIDIPPPPTVESPTSQQGILRLYNQAQVLILVTNLPVSGKPPTPQVTFTLQNSDLGLVPGADGNKTYYTYIWTNYVYTTNITSPYKWFTNSIFTNLVGGYATEPHGIEKFLSLTNTFTDKREYKTNMFVTQIDVHGYTDWLGTNGFNTPKFTSDTPPTILYVADQRNVGTNKLSVVRLVNGATLPNNYGLGWSVATPNPLYVKGNYNVTADGIHFAYTSDSTTNSGTCVPAAVLCDAITILSSSFNDGTSAGTAQNACSTTGGSNTVNAAIITGNVPSTDTTTTTFSGGVQNLMRMLEDWGNGSDYLILNTSIVVLYASQMATQQFRNPIGWTTPTPAPVNPYYTPPHRLWGFDPNFNNPAKQPPGVPTALVPIRFNWTVPPPGTVTNNIGNW